MNNTQLLEGVVFIVVIMRWLNTSHVICFLFYSYTYAVCTPMFYSVNAVVYPLLVILILSTAISEQAILCAQSGSLLFVVCLWHCCRPIILLVCFMLSNKIFIYTPDNF